VAAARAAVREPPFTDADATGGGPTPADRAHTIASMKRNDRATRRRYAKGGDLHEPADAAPADAVMGGKQPGRMLPGSPAAARRGLNAGGRTAGRGLRGMLGGRRVSLAGFLGGMLLYSAGLQLLRNGPAGLSAWFASKFWNAQPGVIGGVTYTPADAARLVKEATAWVARDCTPGANVGPGSQCAAARLALSTAQATQKVAG
jgi:hypothetical protein